MCKDNADDLIIQCHFSNIEEEKAVIERARRAIADDHAAIRKLIQNGASSGDLITDLIYLIGYDTDQCKRLYDALSIFIQALREHPGEFIVIEDIDLEETFHGGPGQISPFPPAEKKHYIVGMIPPTNTFPFIVEPPSETEKRQRLLLKIPHTSDIHIPTELLGVLNEFGDRTRACFFFTDPLEPESISYALDKRIRFWIGNDAVAYCLGMRVISEQHDMRQLRRSIISITEQLTDMPPNSENLSKELSDQYGFYKSEQDVPIAHSAS